MNGECAEAPFQSAWFDVTSSLTSHSHPHPHPHLIGPASNTGLTSYIPSALLCPNANSSSTSAELHHSIRLKKSKQTKKKKQRQIDQCLLLIIIRMILFLHV